jgi:hypothetical protein
VSSLAADRRPGILEINIGELLTVVIAHYEASLLLPLPAALVRRVTREAEDRGRLWFAVTRNPTAEWLARLAGDMLPGSDEVAING